MKSCLPFALVGVGLFLLTSAPAARAQLIVPGSLYGFYLRDGNRASFLGNVYDSPNPLTFSLVANNGTGTITETNALNGNGSGRITFVIKADNDLFPDLGGASNYGGVNLGGGIMPVQLTTPFTLNSLTITFKKGDGTVFASSGAFLNDLPPGPWSGYLNHPGGDVGFTGAVGVNIQEIDIQMLGAVSPAATPEPSALAFLLAGGGSVGLLRCRARK